MSSLGKRLIGGGGAALIGVVYWLIRPAETYEDCYADYLQRCVETKDEGHWGPSFNVKVEDYCAARANVEVTR